MRTTLVDLIGERFGQWTVIKLGPRSGRDTTWECRCSCGTVKNVRAAHLKRQGSLKCRKCRAKQVAKLNTKHGASAGTGITSEYRSWLYLREKCVNPKNPAYPSFGGKGVTMHPAWVESFSAFLNDMGKRPSLEHSLERIDEKGNYEPGNCVWATKIGLIVKRRDIALANR